jgi:hypothetical protein
LTLNALPFLSRSIPRRPFEVVNSEVAVPQGADLGVEVDEAKLVRA